MMHPPRFLWQSKALPEETVSDAAARFIREYFCQERTPRFGKTPGEFWFSDSAWQYQLTFNGGWWEIRHTGNRSPKAQARAKARNEIRKGEAQP